MVDKVVTIAPREDHLADLWALLAAMSGTEEHRNQCLEQSILHRYNKNKDPKLYKGTIQKVTKD